MRRRRALRTRGCQQCLTFRLGRGHGHAYCPRFGARLAERGESTLGVGVRDRVCRSHEPESQGSPRPGTYQPARLRPASARPLHVLVRGAQAAEGRGVPSHAGTLDAANRFDDQRHPRWKDNSLRVNARGPRLTRRTGKPGRAVCKSAQPFACSKHANWAAHGSPSAMKGSTAYLRQARKFVARNADRGVPAGEAPMEQLRACRWLITPELADRCGRRRSSQRAVGSGNGSGTSSRTRSPTGEGPVSKTEGRRFEPCRPCPAPPGEKPAFQPVSRQARRLHGAS